ncbi:MAG TPA: hypothetical protein VKB54_07015 [Solirubrobacteraceae bacterium]|nr:hypothetical protein [Solirubrobacteraceae bacterium]
MRARRRRLRRNPPVRVDGRCVVCGRPRPALAARHGDPFCKTDCARGWHEALRGPA